MQSETWIRQLLLSKLTVDKPDQVSDSLWALLMYITVDVPVLTLFCSMQFTTFIAFALAVAYVGVSTTGASSLEVRQAQTCGLCGNGLPACPPDTACSFDGATVLGCTVSVRTTVGSVKLTQG